MRDSTISQSRGDFEAYTWLVLLTGLALVFSMPSATYVRELLSSPFRRPSPIVFFVTYVFAFAMFGLNRGAAAVPVWLWGRRGLQTGVMQVLMGHLLLVPYLIYVRIILLPKDHPRIILVALYAVVVGLFCAVVGYRTELWGTARGVQTTAQRYALGILYFGVPLLGLAAAPPLVLAAIVSPYGGLIRLLAGAGAAEMFAIYLIPAVAGLLVWRSIRRSYGRNANA